MRISFLIHDHEKSLNDFPLGIAYLISVLRQNGWNDKDIDVYNMDVFHYSDEQLLEYLGSNRFDVVCIGMMAGYWQFKQLTRMIGVIDRLKIRPTVMLGGFMFSPEPEYFMRKFGADYVVMGEGEAILPRLLDTIASGAKPKDVDGVAWWNGDEVVVNPRAKAVKDLDTIPLPAWDRFPIEAYITKGRLPGIRAPRCMPILSSRGCPYTCTFCYRLEKGYRMRSMDNVVEEIKRLKKDYNINSISFRDELLMVSEKRTVEFAERILSENLNIKFDIDGRLRVAKQAPHVLTLLAKAGCVYINYGVESLDQTVLDNMNKFQTIDEIIEGVKATREAGIHSGLNVIFGNVGDNRETAMKTVAFLREYDTYGEMRTLKPVSPYPGAPLYHTAIQKGLIKDCADFYENKHLNSDMITANFTDMTDEEFYSVLNDCNAMLVGDYFEHKKAAALKAHEDVYLRGDTSFRGVRH